MALSIISVFPTNSAMGLRSPLKITAAFSAALNPSTVTSSSFVVTAGGAAVPGVVSSSGATATFTPTNRLRSGQVYAPSIATSIEDVDGNARRAPYAWSFTAAVQPLRWFTGLRRFMGYTNTAGRTGG